MTRIELRPIDPVTVAEEDSNATLAAVVASADKIEADRVYRLDAIRTYVSAVLSVSIIGAVIAAQFTLGVATAGPLTGWGGAVIGYWLGARSGGNYINGKQGGRF